LTTTFGLNLFLTKTKTEFIKRE